MDNSKNTNAPRPNSDRLVEDLCAMVAMKSVNPFDNPPGPGLREEEFAKDLRTRMDALGLETDQREVAPGRPNVWGRLKGRGTGATVMLAAHTDTVAAEGYPEAFNPIVADGKVYGRGSCDMKAAIACYLEVVRLIQEGGIELEGDLIICGVCDEEHTMIGSADAGQYGPQADYGIVGEPTELAICPTHKGELCLSFVTHGRAAHSSLPENGINAVEAMGAVISAFSSYNQELQGIAEPHPLCGTGRFSMTVIRGGDFVSAIPARCEMEVDRRYLPGETAEGIKAEYRERLESIKETRPDFDYTISDHSLNVLPLDIPIESPLVSAVQDAVRTVIDQEPEITAFPGGTDAPNLGFPCVICGPGSIAQAHTINEFVSIDQMVQATAIYLEAVQTLTSLPKPPAA
ncbi:MAG: ArgE/DapE family deacylase [Pseudomonadota bacterium]